MLSTMFGDEHMKRLGLMVALFSFWAAPVFADPALDALVAAYPDHLAGYEGNDLIWKDGTRMPISDGRSNKTFDQLLDAYATVSSAGIETMLVEMIPGPDDRSCSYYTYLDENSEPLFHFTKDWSVSGGPAC